MQLVSYFIVALRKRVTKDLLGSLEKTCTPLETEPTLPFILIFAIIFPFSPGFNWLELAITAAHPQDGTSFLMMSSSSPLFENSKECSIVSDCATVPKS